jgi:hypothetical protein
MSVPIAMSPDRSGFGPQLAISYDSGSGKSPFGFGWSLSLPCITQKTEKGLLQYSNLRYDSESEDVFILSGAEDLVPVYRKDLNKSWIGKHSGYSRNADGWILDANCRFVIHEAERPGYRIRRFRPRVDALVARIERWNSLSDPNNVFLEN